MDRYDVVNYIKNMFPYLIDQAMDKLEDMFGDRLYESETTFYYQFPAEALNEFLFKALKEKSNQKQVERIFDLFEMMANSEDKLVTDCLQVELLEPLWREKIVFDRALQLMHLKTREVNKDIEHYLKKPTE